MQPAEIQTIIAQAATAWIQADAQAFAELFTAEGEFIVPGQRWVGPAAIRQAVADFAATASGVSIKITQIVVGRTAFPADTADRALVEWHWENIVTATGQRQQADDAIAIDFHQGRISRWREYIDTQTVTAESYPPTAKTMVKTMNPDILAP
jgi:uncharacterized protein (TIGR02246 family)